MSSSKWSANAITSQIASGDEAAYVYEALYSANMLISEYEAFGKDYPDYALAMIYASFDSFLGHKRIPGTSFMESALIYMRRAEMEAALCLINDCYNEEALDFYIQHEECFDSNDDAVKAVNVALDELNDEIQNIQDWIQLTDEDSYVEFATYAKDGIDEYYESVLRLLEKSRDVYRKMQVLQESSEVQVAAMLESKLNNLHVISGIVLRAGGCIAAVIFVLKFFVRF